MEEIKDEKHLLVLSSSMDYKLSNIDSSIKPDADESSGKKMEAEISAISDVENNNGGRSSFPPTSLNDSDEKTPAVENFEIPRSEVKDVKDENNLDDLQMEDRDSSVKPDDGTSSMSDIRCNDPIDASGEIKLSEDTCKSAPSGELDHSQMEEGASKKAIENASPGESLLSTSEEDKNKMGPITVEGVAPPVDVRDMQLSDSVNPLEDLNEVVTIVEGTKTLLSEKTGIEESVNFSAADLSDTGPISSGVVISPLQVKGIEEFGSIKNLDIGRKNILYTSENGTSTGHFDVQSNADGNISNNLGSPDSTHRSLPSDESQVANETTANALESTKTSKKILKIQENRGVVDTSAPFESVKSAVSKFGGITDWKAHRSQTFERRKQVQHELEIIQAEIPQYKKQFETAEDEKTHVLEELDSTKRLIEELKLSLEKAETEETQAKQDSELAQLRIKEIEQGIASEASVAAKEQLNVARARHAAALAELEMVKDELKKIQEDYHSLVTERDMAIKHAEEAVLASKEIEKTVEDLTLELITAREELESAHAAHMEAEEHRIGAALARDQDSLNWEKELKQAQDEVQQLNEKLLLVKDLQIKFDGASTLLLNLKSELAAYMEAKLHQESESSETAEATKNHASIQAEIASTKKELEEVKDKIEKAREEVKILKVAAVSLKSELDTEKAGLATMRQREGMASIAVSALEAELNRTKMEIESVQAKEKEVREQMVDLPRAIQQAALEADEAKSAAQSAQEELKKAKEEAEQARASKSTMASRLHAALKEIEATRASERLALAAIKALQESEQASELSQEESHTSVTLPLEKYYALSKEAHEAEEQASERVSAALSQIEVARESEARSLAGLESAIKELAERKEALRSAMEKVEKAKEGKLAVEQELRNWRAENERRRKANDPSQATTTKHLTSPGRSFEGSKDSKVFVSDQEAANLAQTTSSSTRMYTPTEYSTENVFPEVKVKKKKSFFPRIVMFLARKKSNTLS